MLKYPFVFLIAAAVAAASLLTGSPALARTQQRETLSIPVSSAGLDLDDAAGASAMLSRIHRAAWEVCTFEAVDPPAGCIRAKVTEAVARFDNPNLTKVSHNGR
ncbi:MAG TPA: UrcA family protein [Caulobacteraceae bacterium]|jgi:UrcA family protein|nr:UrcA family protein [Caulobacteraceae bacterium]